MRLLLLVTLLLCACQSPKDGEPWDDYSQVERSELQDVLDSI